MKISIDDIPQSPKEIRFSEKIEDLNAPCDKGAAHDFRFPDEVDVEIHYYRSGEEVFFRGSLAGVLRGCCSRCLKDYAFSLQSPFEFVLTPASANSTPKVEQLTREDLGLSYYSTEEINLAPLIREQLILALPTRPLCDENCRGLCGGCGVDLNHEACVCSDGSGDPCMAIFRTLKVGR